MCKKKCLNENQCQKKFNVKKRKKNGVKKNLCKKESVSKINQCQKKVMLKKKNQCPKKK